MIMNMENFDEVIFDDDEFNDDNFEPSNTNDDSFKSNDESIVDKTGRVINAPLTTTTVSYEITVKVGTTSKTIKLYSVVPGTTTWEQWKGTYSSSLIWNKGNFKR